MKTEVHVTFNYGGWRLWFSKEFDLPFTPFFGMWLEDFTEDYENSIRVENNDYCRALICYHVKDKMFEINVDNQWKRPVSDDTVDYTLKVFKNTGWKRLDTTDIKALKELMKREHNRIK